MDVDAVAFAAACAISSSGSIAQAPSAASLRGSPAAAETSRGKTGNVLFSEAGIVDLSFLKPSQKVSYCMAVEPLSISDRFIPLQARSGLGISPMRIGRKLDINPLHTVSAYFIQLRVSCGYP